jgi:light-harvesting complex I chlorophyll a/b binding protein 4
MGSQAWEFLLMHWVEVRRWQDYKNFGSVNQDPIFKGNSVPNPEMGYPGCAAFWEMHIISC